MRRQEMRQSPKLGRFILIFGNPQLALSTWIAFGSLDAGLALEETLKHFRQILPKH